MDYQGDYETINFKIDLISSLFGQQFTQRILNYNQNPIKNNPNHTCTHHIFIANTCTQCSHENTRNELPTIPLWYIYPNLSLSVTEINRIRNQNLQSLITRKKLHLVLDLDHTLLHQRPSCKLTSEDKTFLRDQNRGNGIGVNDDLIFMKKYILSSGWVKLRPFARSFLEQASTMYEMSIYTLGSRSATMTILKILDPEGVYFDNWRVITRDDSGTFDKHKKCLDVVLEDEKVVVVLDDNENVWSDYKGNYLKAIPYNFFSYHSPEDKERDASPPKKSWSQLGGDESEENGMLAKVLVKLREIYSAFYDDGVEGEYSSRDVRDVMKRIEKSGKKKKQYHRSGKKNGRTARRG